MEMNFCRRCGAALSHVSKHIYQCPSGHTVFANPSPCVGVFFVTPKNEVILSERGIEPRKGMLDSFGGFLDGAESFEAAAIRELKEELALEPEDYEPLNYLLSHPANYPYKKETIPVVSVLFWTRLTVDRLLVPADDVGAIRTLPLHDLDLSLLHDEDIRAGIRELQLLFEK